MSCWPDIVRKAINTRKGEDAKGGHLLCLEYM